MKRLRISIAVLVCLALVACAGIQAKWNALTPDQKARVVISDLQGQLNGLFDQGKAYVAAKPQHQALWKSQIVPAIDQANKAIKTVIDLGKIKTLTPDYVYLTINPRIAGVVAWLVQIGAIK